MRWSRTLLCLWMFGIAFTPERAWALNQVTLQPAAANVPLGGSAQLELRINFDQQALGGGIVIELNPAVARFGAFSFDPVFPDDPSLRLVCPDAANSLCAGFDADGGARLLVAFGAVLAPPACSPPLTGSLRVGTLTVDTLSPGQTSVTLREDAGIAGALVGCVGVSFEAPSFSGTALTVATIVDADGDGIADASDNCPGVANALQADGDADAVGDDCDNCPALSNANQGNRDGDATGDGCDRCPDFATVDNGDTDGNGRGNACECGDANGDGRVTVADIVSINVRIFAPNPPTPLCGPGLASPCSLCDADNNNLCNVSDIVAVNVEIFSLGITSRCARSPL